MKHLPWIPHGLRVTQKAECVTFSNDLLLRPRSINYHGWQSIITLDESWFYWDTDCGQVWLLPDEQPSEKPRYTIQDSKLIFSIGWNPMALSRARRLSKGQDL
jgi:hypothetical protein